MQQKCTLPEWLHHQPAAESLETTWIQGFFLPVIPTFANYLYLARPEAAPSVLDILPTNFALRLAIIVAVITLMFFLAYLPWLLKDKKSAK